MRIDIRKAGDQGARSSCTCRANLGTSLDSIQSHEGKCCILLRELSLRVAESMLEGHPTAQQKFASGGQHAFIHTPALSLSLSLSISFHV